jgi:thymidylate kinase
MTARGSRGRVVAVLGPDGSGKSTFSDALVQGPLADKNVLRLHHRPGVVASRSSPQSSVTEPHAGTSYPVLVSLAKLLFLFMDFRVGWWTRIKPFVSGGGWVVWERPWWDIFVDPTRYRLRGCKTAARLLGAALPDPDLVIVLEAPASVLLARKQEVSEAELIRQTEELHKAFSRRIRAVFLDAREPISVLLQQAQRELDLLAEPR